MPKFYEFKATTKRNVVSPRGQLYVLNPEQDGGTVRVHEDDMEWAGRTQLGNMEAQGESGDKLRSMGFQDITTTLVEAIEGQDATKARARGAELLMENGGGSVQPATQPLSESPYTSNFDRRGGPFGSTPKSFDPESPIGSGRLQRGATEGSSTDAQVEADAPGSDDDKPRRAPRPRRDRNEAQDSSQTE